MNRKQTALVVFILLIAAVFAGCKQQQQSQWSQGKAGQNQVVAPPAMVKSPAEIQQLEAIAKANAGNANAWIALGNAQMDAQRFAEAIISYQRALDLDPKNVDVRVDMGTCYRNLGMPDRAVTLYEKALSLEPAHQNALLNLGIVYGYDRKEYGRAIAYWEQLLQVSPKHPKADYLQATMAQFKKTMRQRAN